MKNIVQLIMAIMVFFATLGLAQEKTKEAPKYGWKKELLVGLNLNQTSFDNYKQGGENSNAWQFTSSFKFVNEKPRTTWKNSGKFNYGYAKSGDSAAKKSIDEIKVESVLTYKMGIAVNPFAAVTGETQFGPGYDYDDEQRQQTSDFMDPGYFRESVGMGFKPNEIISTRLGVSMKQTITQDYPVPYADDPSTAEIEKIRNEVGAESVTDLSYKFSENNLLTSKLELFSTFNRIDETDVNWNLELTSKITKYINLNLNVTLLYDSDISKKRQLKQSMAIGIVYSFF